MSDASADYMKLNIVHLKSKIEGLESEIQRLTSDLHSAIEENEKLTTTIDVILARLKEAKT